MEASREPKLGIVLLDCTGEPDDTGCIIPEVIPTEQITVVESAIIPPVDEEDALQEFEGNEVFLDQDLDEVSAGNVQTLTRVLSKYKLTPKMCAFLAAYIETGGNVVRASKIVKINTLRHYRWQNDYPEYKEAFLRIKPMASEALMIEAIRRAHSGTLKPHFYQDRVVGYTREYSDSLMIALLKAKFPDEFKDRSETQIAAKVEAVRKLDPGVDSLPQDRLQALLQLAEKATAAKG